MYGLLRYFCFTLLFGNLLCVCVFFLVATFSVRNQCITEYYLHIIIVVSLAQSKKEELLGTARINHNLHPTVGRKKKGEKREKRKKSSSFYT